MISIRTILVPTDFSECAVEALRYAKQLAESFQSRIHLLYVVPDSALILPEAAIPPMMAMPDMAELKTTTAAALTKLITDYHLEPFHPTVETRIGSPADEIVTCAIECPADLIVIGTHGRGAIAHFLLGSVAERVVRHASCPVLTVRQMSPAK